MDNKPRNRGWVKDAAIVFLVILLILTFFSNTIMNRNLTEVATENINSGTISAKVRGTGKVEANGSYNVKMEKTREVRAVMVKEGDTVNVDDVLFILGEGSADEIEQAQDKVRQLELSYKTTALSMDSYDDSLDKLQIEKADKKIEAATKKVQVATENKDAADNEMKAHTHASAETMEAASVAVEQAMTKLNDISKQIDDILVGFDELIEKETANKEQAQLDLVALKDQLDKEEITQDEYDTKKAELDQKVVDADDLIESYETAKKSDPEIVSLQNDFNTAELEYTGVKAAYDKLVESAGEYAVKLKEAEKELAEANSELEEAKESKTQVEYDIKQSKKSVNKANAGISLQLQDLKDQIERAKQKLEELSGGVENEVRSKVSGTVDSIAFTAGDTVPEGDTLCTITVPDMGYNLSFAVTSDQARRLHVGDSATVTNYYWGSQIVATLSGMKTDPKNPQTSKILTFNLEGDVNPGAELTITVGSKSAVYDYVVPNGALRSDSNGTFIFVIESKSSALGNRYFARRLDVEVLASDDTYSALSADLGWGEYVITTSAKPITNGEQIRMAES